MTLELPELLDIDWSNYAERIGNIYRSEEHTSELQSHA